MKKRYYLTLEEETYEKFKAACRRLKLPVGAPSAIINDSMAGVTAYFEKLADEMESGEKIPYTEWMKVISEEIRKTIPQ